VVIWYIFPVLECLNEEKSGNPARRAAVTAFRWNAVEDAAMHCAFIAG
jgi:hypothetical protein